MIFSRDIARKDIKKEKDSKRILLVLIVKAQVICIVSWAFLSSRESSSDGCYQCIAAKVDGNAYRQFKDADSPPEDLVREPYSFVVADDAYSGDTRSAIPVIPGKNGACCYRG